MRAHKDDRDPGLRDQTAIALLQDQVQQAQAMIEDQARHILDLEAQLEQAKARLDDVYGSRSWKITAPLRGLMQKTGR